MSDYPEIELNEFQIRIRELEIESSNLRDKLTDIIDICIENGLEEEIKEIGARVKSAEEDICISGINHLLKLFKTGSFTKDDTIIFDTLHKNLRMLKGQAVPSGSKKKEKPADIKELLRIVGDNG